VLGLAPHYAAPWGAAPRRGRDLTRRGPNPSSSTRATAQQTLPSKGILSVADPTVAFQQTFRVKKAMPKIGGFQSFGTAQRTLQGFEAMLWLRKGFGFAGAWTVCEQNHLLAVCFGLQQVNKAKTGVGPASPCGLRQRLRQAR
jgi:hypothetical protein